MSNNASKRREKMERRRQERLHKNRQNSLSQLYRRMAGVVIVAVLGVGLFTAWDQGWIWTNPAEHPYAEFAQCLAEADLTMYGTDWCQHCSDQKKMFGDAFEFIDYVNCDFNQSTCNAKGVTGYPTWFVGNEKWADGVQDFEAFAEVSGCELPVDET